MSDDVTGFDEMLMTPEEQAIQRIAQDTYDFDECAEDVAKKRGQVIVYPEANQLQLDIDSKEAYEAFCSRLHYFFLEDEVLHIEEHFSRRGEPHRHITLTLARKLDEATRIALQFALQSDPVREFLNLQRLWYGNKQPTRLFENPLP